MVELDEYRVVVLKDHFVTASFCSLGPEDFELDGPLLGLFFLTFGGSAVGACVCASKRSLGNSKILYHFYKTFFLSNFK